MMPSQGDVQLSAQASIQQVGLDPRSLILFLRIPRAMPSLNQKRAFHFKATKYPIWVLAGRNK